MIGIFDSGIGGATVVKELLKELPNEDYIYYSDSKNNPYGDKDEEDIIKYSDYITNYLIERGCKIIIIACNTASAISKTYLREKYSIPIIAIEPAYKMVYDNAKDKKTLIMATHATLNNKNFIELYKKYDNHNTILCDCSGLAELIEEGKKEEIIKYLDGKISKYKGVENVVLGCTHYPLIKDLITNVLGPVTYFDGSNGVSRHTKDILDKNNLLSTTGTSKIEFIDSNNNSVKKEKFFEIIG